MNGYNVFHLKVWRWVMSAFIMCFKHVGWLERVLHLSVTVFTKASVGIEVAGLMVFALNASAVHWAWAGHLVSGVTPAAQAGLKAILELLAHEVEDDGVDARVHSGQVDAKIIHDQQEVE